MNTTALSRHWHNRLFALAFACMLGFPALIWFTGIEPDSALAEKRSAETFPTANDWRQSSVTWTRQFERYYDDHFGLRKTLLRLQNRLDYQLMRAGNHVIVGEGSWLFLERGIRTDLRLPAIVEDYCGNTPFSERELNGWVNRLVNNWHSARDNGRVYLLAIVPNKHTLYPQYLPDSLRCNPGLSRRMQLHQALSKHDGFPLLDLHKTLAPLASLERLVYNQTDTHWNGVGVLAAYDAMMSALSDRGHAPRNLLTEELIEQFAIDAKGGDLAQMLGLQDVIREKKWGFKIQNMRIRTLHNPFPQHSVDPYRQPQAFRSPHAPSYPSVLIFHDSFVGKTFKHLLAESFSQSTFVWHGRPAIPEHLIEATAPDIVIHEMVERNLLQPFVRE